MCNKYLFNFLKFNLKKDISKKLYAFTLETNTI